MSAPRRDPSIVPNPLRHLRACMFCSLVKSQPQFEARGCENCPFLNMAGDRVVVAETTSPNFEGMIALMNPEKSWVAKWQRINGSRYHPGVYAISVSGDPPREYIERAERRGFAHINRQSKDT